MVLSRIIRTTRMYTFPFDFEGAANPFYWLRGVVHISEALELGHCECGGVFDIRAMICVILKQM